jgi:hypothetical protein
MAEKVSFFPCLPWRNAGCPRTRLVRLQKELGEVEGVVVMWQAVHTNGTGEGFLHRFPFPACCF